MDTNRKLSIYNRRRFYDVPTFVPQIYMVIWRIW